MKKSDSSQGQSASELVSGSIAELGDWRGETLGRMRKLLREADPDVVEEWKWTGTPVWSHDGTIRTGESYKNPRRVDIYPLPHRFEDRPVIFSRLHELKRFTSRSPAQVVSQWVLAQHLPNFTRSLSHPPGKLIAVGPHMACVYGAHPGHRSLPTRFPLKSTPHHALEFQPEFRLLHLCPRIKLCRKHPGPVMKLVMKPAMKPIAETPCTPPDRNRNAANIAPARTPSGTASPDASSPFPPKTWKNTSVSQRSLSIPLMPKLPSSASTPRPSPTASGVSTAPEPFKTA